MEKADDYNVHYKKEGDNLQLITGSVASNSAPEYLPSRIDRKEAQRTSCMQQCCMISFAVVSVVALCASVAAIILVLAFPNVANPAVQEILILKDQLTSQLSSTSAPSTDAGITNLGEELRMIRQTLEASLTSMDTSVQASLNSIGTRFEDSLNSMSTLLERLVIGEHIANMYTDFICDST